MNHVPSASVVIASNRSWELLEACLAAVVPQASAADAEVIVCRPRGAEAAPTGARRPLVRFVDAPPSSDIPELRGIGLAHVRGTRAALTEDHCLPGPGWLSGLLEALDAGADLAGGPMGNARTRRMVDRGAFFAEYGFFAAGSRGERSALTGANVAYGPRVLPRVAAWMQGGEWEDVVHGRLSRDGATLRFVRDAEVRQNGSYRVGAFVLDRFRHGRDYARVRLREAGDGGRLLRLVTTPLLPPVLLSRVGRRAAPGQAGSFLTALPATALFLTAWAVGEAAGYMRGPADRAAGPKRSTSGERT